MHLQTTQHVPGDGGVRMSHVTVTRAKGVLHFTQKAPGCLLSFNNLLAERGPSHFTCCSSEEQQVFFPVFRLSQVKGELVLLLL